MYIYTKEPENASGLSYVALPQMIVNVDGHVARLQVSVQIDMADANWLKENKKEITAIFEIAVARMSPQELRKPEGFTSLQLALKEQLNQNMQTEKVQAVLLTELLLQDQQR